MSEAFSGQFLKLQRGDGGSPEVFTTISEMQKVQGSGSKADIVDVTNMDSPTAFREKMPTLIDSGEISFDGNFVADSDSQQSVRDDFKSRRRGNWKILLPDGDTPGTPRGHWDFEAYVSACDFDAQHDKQVTFSGKLTITGENAYTAGS